MSGGYRRRLEAMIAELEAHPAIEVEEAVLRPPASAQELAAATRLAAGRLPAGVEEVYRELGGIELAWRHDVAELRTGDQRDRGYVHLLPPGRVFGDWKDVVWFDSFPGGERFRHVKPFDLFQPETCACFLQDEGGAPGDRVAVHHLGESLVETGHTFTAYLERLLVSRGCWGWLQTLAAATTDDDEAEACRHRVSVLFPDAEVGLLQP